jgi:spermidine/putrescine transport system substrate-binding protein
MIASKTPLAREMTRRGFARSLASLGLAMVSVPILGRAASAASDLMVMDWSGYEVPELHKPYIAKYGASPEISLFADDEEAYQKVKGGFQADLVHPTSYAVGRYRDQGMLKAFDTSRLSNWSDLYPSLHSVAGMASEGKQWFVPCGWGILSVLYRADLVDIKEESWGLLWDERYKGKLSTITEMDGAVIPAAVKLGIPNPFAMSDDELAKVKAALEQQRGLLRFYWTDPAQLEQAMAAGEVVAAFAWMASNANLKKQGLDVKYMAPKEGVLGFIDGFIMLKEGPGKEQNAYDFVDAWLSPGSGQFMIESVGYGHSNRKAFELASAESKAALGLTAPETLLTSSIFLQEIAPDLRTKYVKMFEDVKAGF